MLTQDTGQLTERSRLLKLRALSSTRQSARVRTAPLDYTGFCPRTLITSRAFDPVRDVISKAGVLVPLAVDGILLNESAVNLSADAQLTGRCSSLAAAAGALMAPLHCCGRCPIAGNQLATSTRCSTRPRTCPTKRAHGHRSLRYRTTPVCRSFSADTTPRIAVILITVAM